MGFYKKAGQPAKSLLKGLIFMSTILAVALPLLALVGAVIIGMRCMKKTGNGKKAIARHFYALLIMLLVAGAFTLAVAAAEAPASTAADGTSAVAGAEQQTATDSGAGTATGLGLVGAGLSIGLAAIGAGIALSAGAPAAIGAVAENPKAFGKSIIFVALGEAVAIYGFIIAILMVIKIPNLPAL